MPNTMYIALFQYTGGEFAPMLLRCCCLTVTVGMDGLISYPEIWSLKASVRRIAACACLCEFSARLAVLCWLLRFSLVSINRNALFYLSVNVFITKVLIGDTIFYVSSWRRNRHFTWSSEPREGLPVCSAKGVPSLLGYFKTLSIGPASGIEPATSRSAVNTLYRLS